MQLKRWFEVEFENVGQITLIVCEFSAFKTSLAFDQCNHMGI